MRKIFLRTLRTSGVEKKYLYFKNYRKKNNITDCPLCKEKVLKRFKYWQLIRNSFPYDQIAEVHHMLVPIRHTSEEDFSKKEIAEFKKLKLYFLQSKKYSLLFETTLFLRTIPAHFHLHLLQIKKLEVRL